MQLFIVNPHRLGPDNEEKMKQLKDKARELKFDCILLSLSDRK